jgi:L-rhamnose mutarotase
MERHTFAMRIYNGKMKEYRQMLGQIWPELTLVLDRVGVKNFSIWNVDLIVFGYCETESGIKASSEDWIILDQLNESMKETFEWISNYREPMRLMYHNFGVIRQSKELICKNVFVTRLFEGMSQEYYNRHAILVEKNADHINPGPISNFSIWNAGDYIFGYNEVDTTMYQERTEEGKQRSIAWENKMLEIMEWITDDIDWITGQHHSRIKCIAQHN